MPSSSSYAARIPRKKSVSAGSKKRRFAGKLRKLRWLIYQKLKFKKKRLKRIFDYYKKQVDLFLMLFSSNLKPFEVVIWKQKVTTTWNDVSKYLSDEKKATAIAVDMPMRTTPEVGGSSKLDSILGMLSTILHLVKMTNAENATSKQEEGSKVDPSEESMNSDANEKVAKVKVDAKNQRKLEIKKNKAAAVFENEASQIVSNLLNDLDFVKEKLHILFMMPEGENGKLQTEAVGQLRSWFEGRRR